MKLIRVAAFVLPILLVFAGGLVAAELSPERLYDQANQQFWDGNYERAEATFRTLIEQFPDDDLYWDARYGLGRTLYKQGQMKQSLDHFQAVRRDHPESSVRGDALFSLAEVAILRNRTIRARELLRTFLDLFPDHVLEPTAREQLKLLQDASGSKTTGDRSVPEPAEETGSPGPRLKSGTDGETPVREVIDPLQKSDTTVQTRRRAIPSDTKSAGTEPLDKTDGESPSGNRISPVETPLPDTQPGPQSTRGSTGPALIDATDTTPDSRLETPDEVTPGTDTGPPGSTPQDTEPVDSTRDEASGEKPDSEPDTPSLSSSERLERVQELYRDGKVAEARQRFHPDLLTDESPPNHYFLAARLTSREGTGDDNQALTYVNRALELHDNPPASYHLLKADFLLSQGRASEAQDVLDSIDPDDFTDQQNQLKAHYYFLRGKASLRRDQPDAAFFEFMDAVRAAPSSRWARQAREIIEDRL